MSHPPIVTQTMSPLLLSSKKAPTDGASLSDIASAPQQGSGVYFFLAFWMSTKLTASPTVVIF